MAEDKVVKAEAGGGGEEGGRMFESYTKDYKRWKQSTERC